MIKHLKKPDWLKIKIPKGSNYKSVKTITNDNNLNTVCDEANCPNIGICWEQKHATFMILGNNCTRTCLFCSVNKNSDHVKSIDNESVNVAKAIKELNLKYCVITSVTRDDLKDGGAKIFYATVKEIQKQSADVIVELLIPDFKANIESLKLVIESNAQVIGHNIETSKRMHQIARPASNYDTSLLVLKMLKQLSPNVITKSSFLVGIGETDEEIFQMINDLKNVNVDIIYIGQYLQPSKNCLPVARYLEPCEYQKFIEYGKSAGIKVIQAGPFIRSSFKAYESFMYLTRTSHNFSITDANCQAYSASKR